MREVVTPVTNASTVEPGVEVDAPAQRDRSSTWARRLRAHVTAALRDVGLPALELLALATFVFARPVLASLGRSAETFVTRGADWTDVAAFVVVVIAAPALVFVAIDLAARLVSVRALRPVHAVLVGVLAALAAWQIGEQVTSMELRPVGGPVCVLVGLAVAALRWRTQVVATFLRYGSLIVLAVVGQFAFTSNSGQILLGGRHVGVDGEVRERVAAAVGDDGPPVVLLVFDGLPTELLMDGAGGIDPQLYPHLAELAGTSTWYRNNTTVAPVTLQAVPAILSGTLGGKADAPLASSYPDNLFTMLGGSYDIHALEPLTGLCPVSLCPAAAGSPLSNLLGDARTVWGEQMRGATQLEFFVPGAFDDRYERIDAWLDAQDFSRGDRPDAYVMHMLLPHDAWEYQPDGTEYQDALSGPTGMWVYTWSTLGAGVGRQRHLLQMQLIDRIVGRVMDDLRAAGTFDDALMVVTADHGYAFHDEDKVRGLTEQNFDQIMWTPLIVKSPGQDDGRVDDANVQTVDVLPTIADELGVDLPWDDLDGMPAGSADRHPDDKAMADWGYSDLRSDDGSPVPVDAAAGFARVLAGDAVTGTGPLALWDRSDGTYGELVGRPVDELPRGEPMPAPLGIVGLDRWHDVDLDRPPLEVLGYTALPEDTTVAVAVNGRVAAVVPTESGAYGTAAVDALLWPDALEQGANALEVFVIEGAPGAPRLRPVTLQNG